MTSNTQPIQEFIQALSSQLDAAQRALSLKASNLNLPLSFALKEIAFDLRAQVEFAGAEVRIRPAGPGDPSASTIRFGLTTITRPMIEENAPPPVIDKGEETLDHVDLTAEEKRRLEWAGVRSVDQLRDLQARGTDREVGRIASLPVDRLRAALVRAAAHPMVLHVLPVAPAAGDADGPPLLRVRGHNLLQDDPPRVTIAGEPVKVVSAAAQELVIAPLAHQLSGRLVVETAPGATAGTVFDLSGPTARPVSNGGAS